ncbi:hypothetical protein [Sporomusa malonica]|uniref:capsular polysaccharide export protein, LipB/KpsS family n=1 Tax=Sporomusa malonica TaxID=112901 RepID=UPI00352B92B3
MNGHQRRYFRTLGNYLKDSNQIYHVDYSSSTIMDILTQPSLESLPTEIGIKEQDIEEIISFLLIKGKYRNFGLIRRFLHSKQVLEAQAYGALKFFHKYINEHSIDLVCVWNGTLIPLAAATKIAKNLGKKTLFFENGYLPNTTTVDPQGVNYANSLVGKPRSFYDEIEIEPEKLRQLYEARPAIRALKAKWYHKLVKNKTQGQVEDIQLPAKYIFVPFQVHDDTQVLLNSSNVKTMAELLDYVVPAVEQYNIEANDSIELVVKEHPSDFGRINYEELRQKYAKRNVIFLRYFPTPQLINSSAGILTINSSVGIEALVQHKPVITMGKAFYNVPGLTVHAAEPAKLSTVLSVVNQQPDDRLIDKFLYYLRYYYLAEGSWRQPDASHLQSVKTKVAALLAEGTSKNVPLS